MPELSDFFYFHDTHPPLDCQIQPFCPPKPAGRAKTQKYPLRRSFVVLHIS